MGSGLEKNGVRSEKMGSGLKKWGQVLYFDIYQKIGKRKLVSK